jgi:general secretion pathway protein H
MPTSTTDRRCQTGEDGFTLFELLAVMVILAMAAAAFSYGGQRTAETAKFRAFITQTSAMLREGRAQAMRSMSETAVRFDTGKRVVVGSDGSSLGLPPGVELSALIAGDEAAKAVAAIRFYPAGNSSGGELKFNLRNQAYVIRVNWLTGNVSSERS